MTQDATPSPPPPWWRHGHVWLLVSGPAVVVVASIITAVIAARGADPVLEQGASRQASRRIEQQAVGERALLPAVQGRNHAATPTARP